MRTLNAMEDFHRDIGYRVLVREDENIALVGTLRDRFHDIELEIVVEGESLRILDGCVAFRSAPSPHCHRVQERLGHLVGVVIGPGLSRRLNAAFGGPSGCGNLRTLLAGLLPLALNVRASAGIDDEKEMLDTIHHHLRGTCVGYPSQ